MSDNKQCVRPKTFADHCSQARKFYVSQTELEQQHICDAVPFELSKVERMDIRERVIGHLRNIDDNRAKTVADGIGLAKLR